MKDLNWLFVSSIPLLKISGYAIVLGAIQIMNDIVIFWPNPLYDIFIFFNHWF